MNRTLVLAGAHATRSLQQPCGVSGLAVSCWSCSAAAALQETKKRDPIRDPIKGQPSFADESRPGASLLHDCLWCVSASLIVLLLCSFASWCKYSGGKKEKEQSLCISILEGIMAPPHKARLRTCVSWSAWFLCSGSLLVSAPGQLKPLVRWTMLFL